MSRSFKRTISNNISPHSRKWWKRQSRIDKKKGIKISKGHCRSDWQTINDYINGLKKFVVPEYKYRNSKDAIALNDFLYERELTDELLKEFAYKLYKKDKSC